MSLKGQISRGKFYVEQMKRGLKVPKQVDKNHADVLTYIKSETPKNMKVDNDKILKERLTK